MPWEYSENICEKWLRVKSWMNWYSITTRRIRTTRWKSKLVQVDRKLNETDANDDGDDDATPHFTACVTLHIEHTHKYIHWERASWACSLVPCTFHHTHIGSCSSLVRTPLTTIIMAIHVVVVSSTWLPPFTSSPSSCLSSSSPSSTSATSSSRSSTRRSWKTCATPLPTGVRAPTTSSTSPHLRFADDVLLFASSKEQLQRMLCEFKRSTQKVGPRIHPKRRKFSAIKAALTQTQKKEMEVWQEEKAWVGQMIMFQQQETTEIKNRNRAAWATFRKYRQELTSKNYMLKHRLQLFDAAITPTICYPSGTWAWYNRRNAKCSDSSYKQKEDTKRSWNTESRPVKKLITMTRAALLTKAKTDKALSLTTTRTATCHSRVDNVEEIDTTEIEEEDCVDYEKKEAPTKPKKRWERRRLDAGTRLTKNEMETGAKNYHTTEWEMVDKSCSMEPRTQLKIQDQQSDWKTKENMRRWHQRIPQICWRKETENLTKSSNQINKTWINTSKDQGRWALLEENSTKWLQKKDMKTIREWGNSQNRPARYVNGVRLSDEEVANITQRKVKRRSK